MPENGVLHGHSVAGVGLSQDLVLSRETKVLTRQMRTVFLLMDTTDHYVRHMSIILRGPRLPN